MIAGTIDWGSNDLSTAAGRRQEDIDNINAIEAAFWYKPNYITEDDRK